MNGFLYAKIEAYARKATSAAYMATSTCLRENADVLTAAVDKLSF